MNHEHRETGENCEGKCRFGHPACIVHPHLHLVERSGGEQG